jgi:hypothetical protein
VGGEKASEEGRMEMRAEEKVKEGGIEKRTSVRPV